MWAVKAREKSKPLRPSLVGGGGVPVAEICRVVPGAAVAVPKPLETSPPKRRARYVIERWPVVFFTIRPAKNPWVSSGVCLPPPWGCGLAVEPRARPEKNYKNSVSQLLFFPYFPPFS